MAVLDHFGELSTAQDLTVGTTDSENVIYMPATDYTAITDVWLVVDCETVATGDGSDTYEFKWVVASESTLDTILEVVKVVITGYTDQRIATAGQRIMAVNIGTMLIDCFDNSSYPYLGLMSVISAGATVSINAAVFIHKPHTKYNTQVVRSNVTIPS